MKPSSSYLKKRRDIKNKIEFQLRPTWNDRR